jgi:hypothetical protein
MHNTQSPKHDVQVHDVTTVKDDISLYTFTDLLHGLSVPANDGNTPGNESSGLISTQGSVSLTPHEAATVDDIFFNEQRESLRKSQNHDLLALSDFVQQGAHDICSYINSHFPVVVEPLEKGNFEPFKGHEEFHRLGGILSKNLHIMLDTLTTLDANAVNIFLLSWAKGMVHDRCLIRLVPPGTRRASSGIVQGSLVLEVGLFVGPLYAGHKKQKVKSFQGPKSAHNIEGHRVTSGTYAHATQGFHLWKYEPYTDPYNVETTTELGKRKSIGDILRELSDEEQQKEVLNSLIDEVSAAMTPAAADNDDPFVEFHEALRGPPSNKIGKAPRKTRCGGAEDLGSSSQQWVQLTKKEQSEFFEKLQSFSNGMLLMLLSKLLTLYCEADNNTKKKMNRFEYYSSMDSSIKNEVYRGQESLATIRQLLHLLQKKQFEPTLIGTLINKNPLFKYDEDEEEEEEEELI